MYGLVLLRFADEDYEGLEVGREFEENAYDVLEVDPTLSQANPQMRRVDMHSICIPHHATIECAYTDMSTHTSINVVFIYVYIILFMHTF